MKMLFMLRDAFIEANPKLIEEARTIGEVNVILTDQGIEKEELKREVADVDVIVVAIVNIDKEIIDAAANLKYIMKFGSGYDNIDHVYAREKGIPVTNVPGQNAEAVADHAFGLMLAAARHVTQKNQEMKSGKWELSMGFEIFNKRLGIIGFGNIGKAIARRANGFHMEISVYANHKDYDSAEKLGVKFVDLDELLSTSDTVVICTNLNEKTRNMINVETLSLMKPTAILINISRGGLVDEDALTEALKNKQLFAAGLDVFADEPTKSELAALTNVIATPHIGAATYEAIERIGDGALANLKRFAAREELANLVN
ncbi:2-hydroxyacid dehydrogenase [Oceanobacillus saliphilus]|uniref:2-hydroxyacid dehydrogenase n=1 Tax=Oceanobacillus saliphilus TaxID=2925834 RepID=UPI00201D46BA|nr:phosphoglycerate dehydrogenase [Oceanobacillus saliphilus]